MFEFLLAYCLFLLKGVTILVLLMVFLAFVTSLKSKKKLSSIRFENLNHRKQDLEQSLLEQFSKTGTKSAQLALKNFLKALKLKKRMNKQSEDQGKRCFVMSFQGDLHASEVKTLREEISAVLQVANIDDEVVLRIESPGGAVPCYGLVASQMMRIKQSKIKLTVCVDKIAASGGYLAAVVADRILAAPFAYIGSIGVVLTMPNFHDFLKNRDVDVVELTAGKHKRSISSIGKLTADGKKHTSEQLKAIHEQFKSLVSAYRPQVEIENVATGDYWTAKAALGLGLVDELTTSDTYIAELVSTSEVWEVTTQKKKTLKSMVSETTQALFSSVLSVLQRQQTGV